MTQLYGLGVSKQSDEIYGVACDLVAPRWGLTAMVGWRATQGCAERQGDALSLGSTLGYRIAPRWGYALADVGQVYIEVRKQFASEELFMLNEVREPLFFHPETAHCL